MARFALTWTALSTAANAAALWASRPSLFAFAPFGAFEFVVLLPVIAAPLAQWITLRSVGRWWGRDWAIGSIAGSFFASAALLLVQRMMQGPFPSSALVIFGLASALTVAVMQWLVLRRVHPRAIFWIAAALLVWGVERALLAQFPAAPGMPRPVLLRASVDAVGFLIQAVALGWIVRAAPAAAAPSVHERRPVWHWLEWTVAAAVGTIVVLGLSAVVEALFAQQRGLGMLVGRPLIAAAAGAIIGTIQWLLLRRLGVSAALIPVSIAALAILPIAQIYVAPFIAPLFLLASFGWEMALQMPGGMVIVGAWFGFCQWLVLRRSVQRAGVWVALTALAWGTYHLTRIPAGISMTAVGLAAGAITGIALFVLEPKDGARASRSPTPSG